jgi:ABC-type sugar transport system ATPase subunit
MTASLLQFDRITKRFPGVLALDDVSFSVAAGQVHALVGENGAGKSTLGKILAGIYQPDGGQVLLDGRPLHCRSPREALARGIGMVHQELSFCEDLSVAENLCLADLPTRCGLLSRRRMASRAEEMLAGIGLELDTRRPVGELSTALQQMVQIAQAVAVGARVIVFDEPTSSLTVRETDRLFELVRGLRARGVTMIYVSHRLGEVFDLCDWVTVLRDGRHVATQPASAIDEGLLVRQMIGRAVEEYFPRHLSAEPGRELLRVEHLWAPPRLHDVSFTVRAGEIVGFAGLVGSGRSELARAIFGLDDRPGGRVLVDGRPLRGASVPAAMRAGIGLVPEDRKRQGLVLMHGGRFNFSLPTLDRFARLGMVNQARERRAAGEAFQRLTVKTPSIDAAVAALSGGNQQKIVLAKWLAAGGKLLIVDEPTRGVDVGAKAAIHNLIDELAHAGQAVWLISSELPEVLNLSTRILVMRAGRIVAEVPRQDATQERLLRLMAGVDVAAADTG